MPIQPKLLLHIEGCLALVVSLVLYDRAGMGWGRFAMLFLAPDLSIPFYLAGARTGAAVYNAVHTYAGPVALVAAGVAAMRPEWLPYALIWTAHIGFDRMLGYGLKYPTHFRDTHLQRVG